MLNIKRNRHYLRIVEKTRRTPKALFIRNIPQFPTPRPDKSWIQTFDEEKKIKSGS